MKPINIIEHTHLKENPFRVPYGYFDSLSQQTSQQISQFSSEELSGLHSTPSFKKMFVSQLFLAASFVLMLGIGFGLVKMILPNSDDTDLPYTEHISVFSTYTLLQNDDLSEPLDSEEIITFLTEQGISPNAIAFLD